MDYQNSPSIYKSIVKSGKKRAFQRRREPVDSVWTRSSHPADVKREYLFENERDIDRWIRTGKFSELVDEQKFKKLDFVLGTVHKRIASNRVEVLVQDAEYLYITHSFNHEEALVSVVDEGKTRVGDYIFAKKTNENSSVATHELQDIIRHNGHVQCPLTGWLIRENRLVDPIEEGEDCFERSYIEELHDQYLDRRVHNYKYRDDFNRDNTTYELRWASDEIEHSASLTQSTKETHLKADQLRQKRIKSLRTKLKPE
ncbi:unnamed protein product [Oikopleura dioica]|uniref:Uncharacterized protein n=1 Tax=Oikopleura dioica TaxID=34765 RepID=E4XBJ6_OIKDI|nr:unnamed protein product [Oikopleura dioica]CBY34394.1 unnamed protein product [Oikopleura dioica]